MKRRYHLLLAIVIVICTGTPSMAYAVESFGGVDIHGFISQGFIASDEYNYLAHNSTDGSFEYNEVGINFSKQLTDELSMSIQFFSRDLGDVANNKVTLDYAYGDYHWRDWLGLRAGKIRLPIGLWNEIRDYDMLRPWIVLPQNRYNDLTRDAMVAVNGAGLYGSVMAGPVGIFDYYLLAGAINTDTEQGYGKYLSNTFAGQATFDENPDAETMYAGSLKWQTPLEGLMVGAWAFTIEMAAPFETTYMGVPYQLSLEYEKVAKGLMAEYTWNNLSLWAEYFEEDLTYTIAGLVTDGKREPQGYYVGAAYRFTDWFQLGSYYAVGYRDGNDKDGNDMAALGLSDHKGWQKDLAVTFRFDLNEYIVFKLEGHQVDGTYAVLAPDNPDNDFSEKDWYYGAAKLSFSF